jgi:hypothetical protein
MKKVLWSVFFAVILMMSSVTADAQGKCKFYIDKTDPMTGQHHKASYLMIKVMGMLSPVSAWTIEYDKMGDDYSIVSRLAVNSNTDDRLEKGDSLLLKLESGKVLTIYAKNTIVPKKIESSGKIVATSYVSTYPITIEDFKLLSSEKILIFRINVGPLVFDQSINDKLAPKLQNMASCILQ